MSPRSWPRPLLVQSVTFSTPMVSWSIHANTWPLGVPPRWKACVSEFSFSAPQGKRTRQTMILCLNLNAAIDKTIVVSSFEIDRIHRPESVVALAGGKGCNVGRALKTLGGKPVVSGWVGGFAGQFIEAGLRREGIQTDFIHADFESRTCTSI